MTSPLCIHYVNTAKRRYESKLLFLDNINSHRTIYRLYLTKIHLLLSPSALGRDITIFSEQFRVQFHRSYSKMIPIDRSNKP